MYSFVLPTRNRPAYLERLLRYYVGRELEAPVIVADSSTEADAVAAVKASCARARAAGLGLELQLHDPAGRFHAKLDDTLGTVRTPYATMVADDDFVVPEGAAACAAHLHANPRCVAVQGRAVVFTLKMEQHKLPVLTATYPVRAVRGASGARRLASHLGWYTPTFYAMMATGALRANMRAAATHCDEYQFGELLPSCLTVVQGELGLVDALYSVRESSRRAAGRVQAPWSAHRLDPRFGPRYARFRAALVAELQRVDGLGATAAGMLVDQLFLRVYLGRERVLPFARRWARQLVDAVRHAPRAVAEAVAAGPAGIARLAADPRGAYWRLVDDHRRYRPDPFRIDVLLDQASPHHAAYAPIHALLLHDLDIADHPMRASRA